MDTEWLYAQVVCLPWRAPIPRQPVSLPGVTAPSRFSGMTVSSSMSGPETPEAQQYDKSVEEWDSPGNGDTPWLVPAETGTTQVY